MRFFTVERFWLHGILPPAPQKRHLGVVELSSTNRATMDTLEALYEAALYLAAYYGRIVVVELLLTNHGTNKERKSRAPILSKEGRSSGQRAIT